MELHVHDLLRLRDPGDLACRVPAPEWVSESLSRTPWVVVRRALVENEFIPIGVRGPSRSERFASFVQSSSIVECVSPVSLSSPQAFQKLARRDELPAMRALSYVHAALRTSDLNWGPVGSVGFELASGVPVAQQNSDLDLVILMSDLLIPPAITNKLVEILEGAGVHVDLLLETMAGAVSFREYARGGPNLLLRSLNGPRLIPHPQGETFRRIGASADRRPGVRLAT